MPGPLPELPYTIHLPETYPAFQRLVAGRSAADLATAVTRIRAFNAATLATDSKRKLQVWGGARAGGEEVEEGRDRGVKEERRGKGWRDGQRAAEPQRGHLLSTTFPPKHPYSSFYNRFQNVEK